MEPVEAAPVADDFRRIAKGAGMVFFGMLASKVLTYAWRLVVARFGTDAYGLMSLGVAVLTIATTLSMLGFANGVERFVAFYYGRKEPKELANALRLGLAFTFASTAVLALSGFAFADVLALSVFGKPELAVILRFLALALPASAFIEIYASAFRGIQRINEVVLARNILDSFFKISLALVPMALGAGIAGLSLGYAAALYLTFISLALLMGRQQAPVLRMPTWDADLVSYSLPLVATSFITTSLPFVDTLVLGVFRSASEVGVYNAAFPMAQLLLIAPTAIFALFLSIITAKYAKDDLKGVKSLYATVSKWVFVVNLPVLAFLVFFSQKTLYYLFGPDYAAAALALSVLAVGNFVFSFCWSSLYVHNMMKKTKELVYIPALSLALSLGLNVLLVPRFGILGAAAASTLALVAYGGLFFLSSYRLLKTFPLDRKSVVFGLASMAAFAGFYLASLTLGWSFSQILIGYAALGLAYVALLFHTDVLGGFERHLAEKAVRRVLGFKFR